MGGVSGTRVMTVIAAITASEIARQTDTTPHYDMAQEVESTLALQTLTAVIIGTGHLMVIADRTVTLLRAHIKSITKTLHHTSSPMLNRRGRLKTTPHLLQFTLGHQYITNTIKCQIQQCLSRTGLLCSRSCTPHPSRWSNLWFQVWHLIQWFRVWCNLWSTV